MIVPVLKDKEFVADFSGTEKVSTVIHLWWLGQSGILIKWNGVGLLIDPYLSDSLSRAALAEGRTMPRASERVVDPLQLPGIDLVLCSSLRPDRLDPETILPLRAANPHLDIVLPVGCAAEADALLGKAGPPLLPVNAGTYVSREGISFHGIDAATPKIRRDQHGNSKELGYLISFGPFSIYYAGETVWHTHLIKQVRRWPVNLAILPIHGSAQEAAEKSALNGFEAAALARAVSAAIAVPCHYDLFEKGNVSTDEFTECCERLGQRYRVLQLGQRLTMGPVSDPSAGKAPPSQPYQGETGLGY